MNTKTLTTDDELCKQRLLMTASEGWRGSPRGDPCGAGVEVNHA